MSYRGVPSSVWPWWKQRDKVPLPATGPCCEPPVWTAAVGITLVCIIIYIFSHLHVSPKNVLPVNVHVFMIIRDTTSLGG